MLTVPARVKPSGIHGLGLFSAIPIRPGSVVWVYSDPPDYRVRIHRWKKMRTEPLGAEWLEFRRKYAYRPHGKMYIEFPGDHAMFINHSEKPNIVYKGELVMMAVREIEVGEEILADYRTFESDLEGFACAGK